MTKFQLRAKKTLTWIIPGFYCLLCILLLAGIFFPSAIRIPEDTKSMGVYISILIFTIPILSLIIGWFFDAYCGYLFRYIMKWPIKKGYFLAFHREVSTKRAEQEFDEARDCIELKNVDRFYYRYVFSRNMFGTQLAVLLMNLLFLIFSEEPCDWSCLKYLVIGILIFMAFIPIVARDLTTHVKYVFLEDQTPDDIVPSGTPGNFQQPSRTQN